MYIYTYSNTCTYTHNYSNTCTYTHNYSNTCTYTHTVIQVQVLHTTIHMYYDV